MSMFRHGAVPMAAGMLLVQLCVLAAAGVMPAFCCPPAARAADGVPECCKGDGHTCPLMKLKQHAPAPEAGGLSFRSCPRTNDHITALLFGTSGVLVSIEPLAGPELVAAIYGETHFAPVARVAVESPPPRA